MASATAMLDRLMLRKSPCRGRRVAPRRGSRRRGLRRLPRSRARWTPRVRAGGRRRGVLPLARLSGEFPDPRERRPRGSRHAPAHGAAPGAGRPGDDRAHAVRRRLLRADLPHARDRIAERGAAPRLRCTTDEALAGGHRRGAPGRDRRAKWRARKTKSFAATAWAIT